MSSTSRLTCTSRRLIGAAPVTSRSTSRVVAGGEHRVAGAPVDLVEAEHVAVEAERPGQVGDQQGEPDAADRAGRSSGSAGRRRSYPKIASSSSSAVEPRPAGAGSSSGRSRGPADPWRPAGPLRGRRVEALGRGRSAAGRRRRRPAGCVAGWSRRSPRVERSSAGRSVPPPVGAARGGPSGSPPGCCSTTTPSSTTGPPGLLAAPPPARARRAATPGSSRSGSATERVAVARVAGTGRRPRGSPEVVAEVVVRRVRSAHGGASCWISISSSGVGVGVLRRQVGDGRGRLGVGRHLVPEDPDVPLVVEGDPDRQGLAQRRPLGDRHPRLDDLLGPGRQARARRSPVAARSGRTRTGSVVRRRCARARRRPPRCARRRAPWPGRPPAPAGRRRARRWPSWSCPARRGRRRWPRCRAPCRSACVPARWCRFPPFATVDLPGVRARLGRIGDRGKDAAAAPAPGPGR